MNTQAEEKSSSNNDASTTKHLLAKDTHETTATTDSNDSDSSSSHIKIIINNHPHSDKEKIDEDECRKETNDSSHQDDTKEDVNKTDHSNTHDKEESMTSETSNENHEQKETSSSPSSEPLVATESKPGFIFESRLSQSVVNNLFNSSIQKNAEHTANATKLRPSVLCIDENRSPTHENDSNNDREKLENANQRSDGTNLFAMPTDNKKPTFGSFFSSKSSFGALSATVAKDTSSILTDKNNEETPSTANYFTENLFQQASDKCSLESTSGFGITSSSSNEDAHQSSSFGGSFVFGQNLQDRVTNVNERPQSQSTVTNEMSNQNDTSSSSTNNTPNSTPTSAFASSIIGSTSSTIVPEKRKFENITGEEEEINVAHIYCKLFHWESKSASWKERGKGNLRLNDKYDEERTSSRLIMRTAGSLKLILNCLIQSGMKFELNSNCIRFSNVDGIYLVKGKKNDIDQIYQHLEQRLKMLPKKSKAEIKQREEEDKSIENSFEIKEKLRLTKDDDDSRDVTSEQSANEDSSFRTLESEDSTSDKEHNDEQCGETEIEARPNKDIEISFKKAPEDDDRANEPRNNEHISVNQES